jgi:hypothetical protein
LDPEVVFRVLACRACLVYLVLTLLRIGIALSTTNTDGPRLRVLSDRNRAHKSTTVNHDHECFEAIPFSRGSVGVLKNG